MKALSNMGFKLFNTMTRQVEDLRSPTEGPLTMYTCGPTVYNDQHIGNYRTFIFEDVLIKSLERYGYTVRRVMNITDVGHLTSDADEGEDKLEVGARREGKTAWEIAAYYTERFIADLQELQITKPDPLVRATAEIPAQIALVQALEQRGYTYLTSDGVYFDSTKVPDYGKLARLDIAGLHAGARVEIGEKHHSTDFALWKFSPEDQKRDMEWDSPWGKGFPGWHLECSAIIRDNLGDTIDIHCGGVDHIPIHHTNEIAQSEAATGKSLALIWSHGEFLLVDGGKMAKSLGNVYTVADIKNQQVDPLALRLLFYSASYRHKLNFTWEGLHQAAHSLRHLREVYQATDQVGEAPEEALKAFNTALFNDLNVPEAMAVLWKVVRGGHNSAEKRAFLKEADTVLSLDLAKVEKVEVPEDVQALLQQREAARVVGDFATADKVRDEITKAGFVINDTAEGSVLLPKN